MQKLVLPLNEEIEADYVANVKLRQSQTGGLRPARGDHHFFLIEKGASMILGGSWGEVVRVKGTRSNSPHLRSHRWRRRRMES